MIIDGDPIFEEGDIYDIDMYFYFLLFMFYEGEEYGYVGGIFEVRDRP